jgi:hypothetical protein
MPFPVTRFPLPVAVARNPFLVARSPFSVAGFKDPAYIRPTCSAGSKDPA